MARKAKQPEDEKCICPHLRAIHDASRIQLAKATVAFRATADLAYSLAESVELEVTCDEQELPDFIHTHALRTFRDLCNRIVYSVGANHCGDSDEDEDLQHVLRLVGNIELKISVAIQPVVQSTNTPTSDIINRRNTLATVRTSFDPLCMGKRGLELGVAYMVDQITNQIGHKYLEWEFEYEDWL